jgi:hypothetical protein
MRNNPKGAVDRFVLWIVELQAIEYLSPGVQLALMFH